MSMDRPKQLKIHVEDGGLVGVDQDEREWVIRWCGNGAYSHWWLRPKGEEDGFYVFCYPPNNSPLEAQIRAAEARFHVY